MSGRSGSGASYSAPYGDCSGTDTSLKPKKTNLNLDKYSYKNVHSIKSEIEELKSYIDSINKNNIEHITNLSSNLTNINNQIATLNSTNAALNQLNSLSIAEINSRLEVDRQTISNLKSELNRPNNFERSDSEEYKVRLKILEEKISSLYLDLNKSIDKLKEGKVDSSVDGKLVIQANGVAPRLILGDKGFGDRILVAGSKVGGAGIVSEEDGNFSALAVLSDGTLFVGKGEGDDHTGVTVNRGEVNISSKTKKGEESFTINGYDENPAGEVGYTEIDSRCLILTKRPTENLTDTDILIRNSLTGQIQVRKYIDNNINSYLGLKGSTTSDTGVVTFSKLDRQIGNNIQWNSSTPNEIIVSGSRILYRLDISGIVTNLKSIDSFTLKLDYSPIGTSESLSITYHLNNIRPKENFHITRYLTLDSTRVTLKFLEGITVDEVQFDMIKLT